eukprot:2523362-Rhodomonas_salina.2
MLPMIAMCWYKREGGGGKSAHGNSISSLRSPLHPLSESCKHAGSVCDKQRRCEVRREGEGSRGGERAAEPWERKQGVGREEGEETRSEF